MIVKIFTRSVNYELFHISGQLIGLNYPRVRLTNTRADGYFYRILAEKDCDWAINIDEDAFVVDDNALSELLEYVMENGYVNCGMPDNQTARYYNPAVTNPFFNIINLKAIREQFNKEEIEHFKYMLHAKEILEKVPSRFLNTDRTQVDNDNEEPYYPFFLWMALRFPTLYLDSEFHKDGISTILKNHKGRPMIYHSWFSRCWRTDDSHTRRIAALYNEATAIKGISNHTPKMWEKWTPWDRRLQILSRKYNTILDRLGVKQYVR